MCEPGLHNMHETNPPISGENQSPLDLAGCRSVIVPTTNIQLLAPDKDTAQRLDKELNVSGRLSALRKTASHAIGDRERFAQDCQQIGFTADGNLIYLLVSILTTRRHWRGGWFVCVVPVAEAEAFAQYLATAQSALIADLRKERLQGSRS